MRSKHLWAKNCPLFPCFIYFDSSQTLIWRIELTGVLIFFYAFLSNQEVKVETILFLKYQSCEYAVFAPLFIFYFLINCIWKEHFSGKEFTILVSEASFALNFLQNYASRISYSFVKAAKCKKWKCNGYTKNWQFKPINSYPEKNYL